MSAPDGGPAFPHPIAGDSAGIYEARELGTDNEGMSLRDWFAGQALAFLAHPARMGVSFDPVGDAGFAYAVADAMLAARATPTESGVEP